MHHLPLHDALLSVEQRVLPLARWHRAGVRRGRHLSLRPREAWRREDTLGGALTAKNDPTEHRENATSGRRRGLASRAMRALAPITFVALLAACETTTPTGPRTRTVADSRRSAGGSRNRRAGNPPPVDSLRQCPAATSRALSRYRAHRSLHFGPLCTDVFNGRFSAVMATGTESEASDVWVLFHDPRGDEVHRVKRFPVGARITFGRIVQGWVYLLGRSNALEDMPAGAQLLTLFPLPRPGDSTPPEVGLLSPLETPLLRASDVDDLDRRLAFPMPPRDPSAVEAERTIMHIARGGPNTLLDHLSPEGAPTLRAWQVGMFQETDYISPQGDPASPRLANAMSLLRSIAESMDCSRGDRCIARTERALEPGAAPGQIFLRYEGQRVIVAALLAPAPPAVRQGTTEARVPWGPEVRNTPDDRALAESLTLDGTLQGDVVSATRGEARALAFQVARTVGGVESRLYVLEPGHAPRPFTDHSIGDVNLGTAELHLRDYERDGGIELVTFAQGRDNTPVFSVASVQAPPTVAQHDLTHRLDMHRVAFGATDLRTLDARLRSFRGDPADRDTACGVLDRVADGDTRTFLQATGGVLATITYREAWQPLRGEPARLQRRELQQRGVAALGPFANARCQDLTCDWSQSLCRLPGDNDRGVLWFADGGRRIAAVSLREGPP